MSKNVTTYAYLIVFKIIKRPQSVLNTCFTFYYTCYCYDYSERFHNLIISTSYLCTMKPALSLQANIQSPDALNAMDQASSELDVVSTRIISQNSFLNCQLKLLVHNKCKYYRWVCIKAGSVKENYSASDQVPQI